MTYMWRCDIQAEITCGGGGKGGSGGTTTTTSGPPQWLQNAYQGLLGQAQGVASTPYQPYTGQLVAPFTQDQVTAGNTIASTQGMTAPYTNSAQTDINAGTQAIYPQLQQYNQTNLSGYENPYTNDVINSTMALANQQDATQQSSLAGNAIQSGASPFGGDRAGVAAAALAGQQDLANNQTIAGLNNQNFTQAQSELNNQQQLQANTQSSDAWRQLSGGQSEAQLGTTAQNNDLTQASAQLQSGAIQQQEAQENLNVPYEQYQAEQAYPFQTTGWLGSLESGLGGVSGGTSSTTAPSASTASQLTGLGLTGLAEVGATGGFGSTGWLSSLGLKSGGIAGRHLATGGGSTTPGSTNFISGITSGVPDVSVDYIPQLQMSGHANLPSSPKTNNSSPSALSDLQTGSSIGKLMGNLGGSPSSPSNLGGISPAASSIFGNNTGGSFGADTALSQSASDNSAMGLGASGSLDNIFGSTGGSGFSFSKGGATRRNRYDIGGQVLPDIVSGVGDVVGAFFGMPMAGDTAVSVASNLDGGRTYGQGDLSQAFGAATNSENSSGNGLNGSGNAGMSGLSMLGNLKRGGVAGHYDAGGMITTPQQAAVAGANPIQQQQSSQYNNMSLNQLMQLATMQPNNPMIQRAIQMKKMGAGAAGGNTMARGGVMPHFDDGGSADSSAVQELQDIASGSSGVAAGNPVAQLDSNSQSNGIGDVNSSDLLPPDAKGIAAPAAVINDSSQPLPKPEGELDAKPAVDHSGDMVKIHSEGKTIDTGLPSFKDSSVSSSAWEPLLAAGLATMAGRSPNALTNIGEGGLAGLQAAGEQRQAALKENQAQAEQQKLANDLDLRRQEAEQTKAYQTGELGLRGQELSQQQKNQATEMALKQQQLEQGKYSITPDGMGGFLKTNNKTGDVERVSGGMGGFGGSMNAPVGGTPPNAGGATTAPGGTNAAVLQQLPPQIASQVKALAEGRMQFPGGFALKSPYWKNMISAVSTYDPSFDAVNYNARAKARSDFTSGKEASSVNALNTVAEHLGKLQDAYQNLDNTSVPAWNYLANATGKQLGSSARTNFDTVVGPVAEEMTKAYRGSGGNEADISRVMQNLNSSMSPKQANDAFQELGGLLKGKIDSLQDQYKRGMGTSAQDKSFYTPQTMTAFKKMGIDLGDQNSSAGNQSATGQTTQPPMPGAQQAPDGNWYIKGDNGKYQKVVQ